MEGSVAGFVDGWIGFPTGREWASLAGLRAQLHASDGPIVEHLFGHHDFTHSDPIAETLRQMDAYGIEIGLVQLEDEVAVQAVIEHPSRFAGVVSVDPNRITPSVRRIRDAVRDYAVKAVYTFPAGSLPQTAIDDRHHYPIYQTCVDLELAVIVNAGIAGPRVPSWGQDVMRLDRVCYDFPDLRIVMCHGGHPWEALAVALMAKWPGLHYMTSGFAPKHYPQAVIDFANTRGADKVIYGGYYPFGLSLERIFGELSAVPFREHVRPKFMSDNARRVFRLPARSVAC